MFYYYLCYWVMTLFFLKLNFPETRSWSCLELTISCSIDIHYYFIAMGDFFTLFVPYSFHSPHFEWHLFSHSTATSTSDVHTFMSDCRLSQHSCTVMSWCEHFECFYYRLNVNHVLSVPALFKSESSNYFHNYNISIFKLSYTGNYWVETIRTMSLVSIFG